MKEDKHEALSALVDGELSADDGPGLLDQVLADVSLRRRWSTYHLIGDVIRKHVIDQQAESEQLDNSIDASNSNPAKARHKTGRLRPLAGLALAASVALVAVLGIFALTGGQQATIEVAQSSSSTPVSIPSKPSPTSVVGGAVGIDMARMTWNDAAPAVTNRLNGYLVTHNEYLSNERRGMLPYARIVAYDEGQN